MGFLFKELLFEQPGKRLIYNKGHCRVYKRLKRVERDKATHIAPYVALRLGIAHAAARYEYWRKIVIKRHHYYNHRCCAKQQPLYRAADIVPSAIDHPGYHRECACCKKVHNAAYPAR